jgi:hypothetical protein
MMSALRTAIGSLFGGDYIFNVVNGTRYGLYNNATRITAARAQQERGFGKEAVAGRSLPLEESVKSSLGRECDSLSLPLEESVKWNHSSVWHVFKRARV